MDKNSKVVGYIVLTLHFCLALGCTDPGVVVTMKLPFEPTARQRLQIIIDEKQGKSPREIRPREYEIEFDADGVAKIKSPELLHRFRRTNVESPKQLILAEDGVRETNSEWKLAYENQPIPGGGVRTKSVVHGSKLLIELNVPHVALPEWE